MAPKNDKPAGEKKPRAPQRLKPLTVFVLLDTAKHGLDATALKESLVGFKMSADEAIDFTDGKANLTFVRLFIPRTGKPRKPVEGAPAAAAQ